MPFINCPDCRKRISSVAPICPECGRPMKRIKDKIIKLDNRLKDLERARQDLDNDRHYYEANPHLEKPDWWESYYSYINKIEEEIDALKESSFAGKGSETKKT